MTAPGSHNVFLTMKIATEAEMMLNTNKQTSRSSSRFHDLNADISSKVDNVSRFLRYLQPTGSEPSLDFLTKSRETRDFLTALKRTDMCPAAILYYIKSMKRFLEYLTLRLDLKRKDPQLRTNCQSYTNMLKTLRKTLFKTHNLRLMGFYVCLAFFTNFLLFPRIFFNNLPCLLRLIQT